jgi:hypothetical protein
MRRFLLSLILFSVAVPAAAADRTYSITSFDRIRIDGPYDVRLTVGGSPRAVASADADMLDDLDVRVEGSTLVVGSSLDNRQEQNAVAHAAPVITLSTPDLRSATVIGGGKLVIDGRMKAQRLDLQLNGSGALGVSGVQTDELYATLLGSGVITLAGTTNRARLITSGPGTIAATPLTVRDLTVSLDGTGETDATARYTAAATSTGLGRIVIQGDATCTVKALAGGPIVCGKASAPQ